jgi:hypothetical protein
MQLPCCSTSCTLATLLAGCTASTTHALHRLLWRQSCSGHPHNDGRQPLIRKELHRCLPAVNANDLVKLLMHHTLTQLSFEAEVLLTWLPPRDHSTRHPTALQHPAAAPWLCTSCCCCPACLACGHRYTCLVCSLCTVSYISDRKPSQGIKRVNGARTPVNHRAAAVSRDIEIADAAVPGTVIA